MKKTLQILIVAVLLLNTAYSQTTIKPPGAVSLSGNFLRVTATDSVYVEIAGSTKKYYNLGIYGKINEALIKKLDIADSVAKYVTPTRLNAAIAGSTIPDATTTVKGKIKLAGDLSGTADLPTVPGLLNKVDKVAGKGLSTEDYTSTEKTKLAGIASGATANQSDAFLRARPNHTGTQPISTVAGLQPELDSKIPITEKGVGNGVATLDASGKIPLSQVNDALIGSVNYQGTYNVETNIPTLPTPELANKGWYYLISNEKTVFQGDSVYAGDWVISDGLAWGSVRNNRPETDPIYTSEKSTLAKKDGSNATGNWNINAATASQWLGAGLYESTIHDGVIDRLMGYNNAENKWTYYTPATTLPFNALTATDATYWGGVGADFLATSTTPIAVYGFDQAAGEARAFSKVQMKSFLEVPDEYSNGLTKTGSTVKLGGALTGVTDIGTYNTSFQPNLRLTPSEGAALSFSNTTAATHSSVRVDYGGVMIMSQSAASSAKQRSLWFPGNNTASSISLVDNSKLQGIVNAGDYEANFVPRSLVTKQYVDGLVAELGTGTVTNVSSSDANISVATGTTTPVLTLASTISSNTTGNAATATQASNATTWNNQLYSGTNHGGSFTEALTFASGQWGVTSKSDLKASLNISDGTTLNNNISGNAATATRWGGETASLDAGYGTNPNYFIGYDLTAGTIKPIQAPAMRTFLGIPSGGYDLQSVTDLGNITTKGISAENYNIGSGTGTRGSLAHDDSISQLYLQNYKTDGIISLYPTPTVRAMDILANGNVGIGTTAPTANSNRTTLSIDNATWGGQLDIDVAGVNHAQFGTDIFNSGLAARIQSKDGIVFNTNGNSEKMRITADGNVGIGTTSPTARLHVNGATVSANTDGRLVLQPGSSSGANSISSLTADASAYQGLSLYSQYITMYNPSTSTYSDLTAGTGNFNGNMSVGDGYGLGGYKTLSLGSTTNGPGLLKLISDYNSGDGAEIYQNTNGDLAINLNSNQAAVTFKPDGSATITGSTNSGVSQIGTWMGGATFARFGHKDFNTGANYGFLQRNDGAIFIEGSAITSNTAITAPSFLGNATSATIATSLSAVNENTTGTSTLSYDGDAGAWKLSATYAGDGNLMITDGGLTVSGSVIAPTAPTLGTHLANKTYVDNAIASSGTSGVYTPTLTPVNNINSHTSQKSFWTRTGNIVNVTGSVTITPTTTGTVVFRLTLPPSATTTLSTATDLVGVVQSFAVGSNSTQLIGDIATSTASISINADDGAARLIRFQYSYEIN